MQFVFENPADESDQHVVNWLEDVARPVVEAGMKSADDVSTLVAVAGSTVDANGSPLTDEVETGALDECTAAGGSPQWRSLAVSPPHLHSRIGGTFVMTARRRCGAIRLEKISGGLPKLAKKWTWSSPSYHSAYLQETTVNAQYVFL